MQHKDKLDHYHALLLKWQKTINLVSPMTLADAWVRHFEDSLQLLQHIPKDTKIICDIGSGAGFPGMVLAIGRPDIHFHFIESDVRKCAFLRTVSRETLCANVTIHSGRIEDIIADVPADVITSRALASLRQLMVYTRDVWSANPALKMILPKGKNYLQEIDEANRNYLFTYDEYSSETDDDARILIVGNIAEK